MAVKPDPASTAKVQNAETLNQKPADAPAKVEKRAEDTLVTQSPVQTKEDDPKSLPGNGATAEVETIKVKTKGDFMLMDPFSARHITPDGDEVPVTTFINDELAEGGRLEKA